MLIDWFTVVAQIFNFLVLVGLLKYFLFDRITKAMDERERTIASALEEAEKSRRIAEEEAVRFRRRAEDLEDSRRRLLDQARSEADSLRLELVQRARSEVDRAKAGWEETLEKGKRAFLGLLRKRVAEQTLSIARSALRDLANSDLEERIVRDFMRRFHDMSSEDLEAMRAALQNSKTELVCRTAFELSDGQKEDIAKLLCSHLSESLPVRFEQSASDPCGIVVRFQGHKIGWTIDSYLDGLERSISATLLHGRQPEVRRTSDGERETNRRLEPSEVPGVSKMPVNKIDPVVRTEDDQ